MKRFEKYMKKAGLTYDTIPCVTGTSKNVNAAVREGLLPPTAKEATRGKTTLGLERARLIGMAIAHLRILKTISEGNVEIVNVFEDDEVVYKSYRSQRDR